MLGYRAHFQVADRHAVLETSLDQFQSWLAGKGYDPSSITSGATTEIAPGVEASLLRMADRGVTQSLRAQVVERRAEGAWTSELTVHIPAEETESAEILLDIYSPAAENSRPTWTGVPRLARGLLNTLVAQDSLARLTELPILIRLGEVEALCDAIRDPNRRGLLFVAGSADSLPLKAWTKYVSTLLRQTTGLASAYVLDTEATAALGRLLSPTHAVEPGTLRTYLPGVDLESELDARRHRILSTTRIVNDRSQWIAEILGRKARENALEAELPVSLQTVLEQIAARSDDALLHHLTNSHVSTRVETADSQSQAADAADTDDVRTSPPATAETETVAEMGVTTPPANDTGLESKEIASSVSTADESYLAAAAVMQDILGVSEPSPEDWAAFAAFARAGMHGERKHAEVASRLEDLREEVSQSSQERRNLTRRLEDEQLEHAAMYSSLTAVENEMHRLRALLLRTEEASSVYIAPGAAAGPEAPSSFVDLVANLSDLPGLVFTGDASVAVRLDVHDPLGVWASKTWAILQALSDYAQASASGRCDRDVHGYLLNLPDGCRGYSANKHAANESEDVQRNPKFAEARTFPVPEDVSPIGSFAMMAHFKIAQSGLISPRLHYFDDVRRTANVYVGYIGPHLPTKRTN